MDGGAWGAVVDGVDVVDGPGGEEVVVALVGGGAVPTRTLFVNMRYRQR